MKSRNQSQSGVLIEIREKQQDLDRAEISEIGKEKAQTQEEKRARRRTEAAQSRRELPAPPLRRQYEGREKQNKEGDRDGERKESKDEGKVRATTTRKAMTDVASINNFYGALVFL
ncbi:hypothetical protein PIB30_038343 [Stylosanthes scabra]|uniref:Uncharacterized protein n=1 Tax=Stylosanthes scabra TaxID=79078 RepID=A0ABU6XD64_9FABA|nr:hypothetical protein [Stylosanthes scabra]